MPKNNKTTKCKSACNSKCKTPTLNVFVDKIEGVQCRWVKLDNKKTYFASDLVQVYGKGFMSKLEVAPKKMRVAHEGNSQTRLMVPVAELKMALRK
jgi:hypothetical protein